jgi:hemoglobin
MADDDKSLFERIGGEAGVRRLVDRFYDLMDTLPEAREIRALHPASLEESRNKLHWFLCGWMGGPPLYVERFGHPRLRARHLPFPIAERERDQWLTCMQLALVATVEDPKVRDAVWSPIVRLADHMRNQQ